MKHSLLKLALECEEQMDAAEAVALAQDIQSDEEEAEIVVTEKTEEAADAVEAADSLEELIAVVEPAQGETIEANPIAEKVLAVAVEQIFERWGQPVPASIAMEDGSQIDIGGKIAKIKEWLIKLWQRIVEAFSSIYDSLSDFLATAFSAATRLEKAAIALLRESRAVHGTPRHSTYSNRDMAKRLSGDNTVGLIKLYQRTLDLTELTVRIAYAEPAKILGDVVSQYNRSVHDDNTTRTPHAGGHSYQALINQLPKAMHDAYTARFMKRGQSNVQANDVPENTDVYTTPILLGNVAGVVIIPQSVEKLDEFSFKILPVADDTGGHDDSSDVSVSDIREQDQLLKMVIHNCGEIRRFNKNQPALKKLDVELRQTLKILKLRNNFKMDREIESEQRDVIRAIARSAPRIAQGIHHKALAFSLNSSRTILKHVQMSIHAYEGNQIK